MIVAASRTGGAMHRPAEIVTFERCYLLAYVFGAANTAVHWRAYQALPQVAAANETLGPWYVWAVTLVGLLVPILLWYLVARRASNVARWVLVLLVAFGAASFLYSLMSGGFLGRPAMLMSAAGTVLNVIAAVSLFRGGAPGWFARGEA